MERKSLVTPRAASLLSPASRGRKERAAQLGEHGTVITIRHVSGRVEQLQHASPPHVLEIEHLLTKKESPSHPLRVRNPPPGQFHFAASGSVRD